MKNMMSVLVLCTMICGGMALATQESNPCGNSGNNCSCTTPEGSPIDVAAVCAAQSDADAIALCRSKAESDSFATAVCGSLNFNQTAQICAPYVQNNANQICSTVVEANPSQFCGLFVENEVEAKLTQRIGDIANYCAGDVNLTTLLVKFGNVESRCAQSQLQSQRQQASCSDSSVNSFDASQSCAQATQVCATNVAVSCPDTKITVNSGTSVCRRCKTLPNGVTKCRGCVVETKVEKQ